MSKRYQHVLSPIKIGNQVLKTRLIFPHAVNHTLQGTEDFPADPLITFYSEVARNGADLVTITAGNPILPKGQRGDRFVRYDLEDPRVYNYMSQHVDAIHFYGGKVTVQFNLNHPPKGYQYSPKPPPPPGKEQFAGGLEVLPYQLLRRDLILHRPFVIPPIIFNRPISLHFVE